MNKQTLINNFKKADERVNELEKTDIYNNGYGVEKSDRLMKAYEDAQKAYNECIKNDICPFYY